MEQARRDHAGHDQHAMGIGITNYRNRRVKFGIKTDDRRRHVYLIGKTGMGKSTALENMIIQDIRYGHGLAVVDPHGDTAEKIIDYIPSDRINDVIYFNPADSEYPIAFNVFEKVPSNQRHLVASGMVGVFKKLYAESWGPRLEYLLRNAILALLDYPDSTLLGVNRILVDKAYRKKVIAKIEDPVVKSFWVDEYSRYPDKFQVEAISPIQNKVGQFLSMGLIRNILGQVKSSLDMRSIIDDGKVLILNLSKGRIGEDASSLLGAMMITKIQLATMQRVDTPEEERRDFYLYVDEFQNFSTESFANILSEARKYRLNLTIAHQYIEQLDEEVSASIFGNVGTLVVFRVGATDAEYLVKEFAPYFTEEDLVNLTKFNVYMRLMIDGVASDPFSALSLPPIGNPEGSAEKVINVSRERYATAKEVVEEKIRRWAGMAEDQLQQKESADEAGRQGGKGPSAPSASRKEKKKMFPTKCWHCGDDTQVPFEPDGKRPILCEPCLEKSRKGEIGKLSTPPPKQDVKKPAKTVSLEDLKQKEPKKQPEEFSGKPRIMRDEKAARLRQGVSAYADRSQGSGRRRSVGDEKKGGDEQDTSAADRDMPGKAKAKGDGQQGRPDKAQPQRSGRSRPVTSAPSSHGSGKRKRRKRKKPASSRAGQQFGSQKPASGRQGGSLEPGKPVTFQK